MDSWLSFVIFFVFLCGVVTSKYRILGLVSSIFLAIGCCSIYSIFLLTGLTYGKSTLFGALALLFFAISNSLHLFSWIKKYLRTNNYTVKMAMYLASKKHNVYLYELALILLIPSSLMIFLLPTALKEMGIVLALGSLFIFAIWFLFSNFYLPKLSYLGEKSECFLFSKRNSKADRERATQTYTSLVKELRDEGRQADIRDEIKRRKSTLAPLDFAPLVFLLGLIGFILWLSNCELNYPNFFKGNKLLSVDGGLKGNLKKVLDGIKGSFRDLKNIPTSIKNTIADTSSNWSYYLFPKSFNLDAVTEALKKADTSTVKNIPSGGWHIQDTDAFSVMPSLEKAINLIFFSLIPLTCYNLFRFGIVNAFSLTLSSLLFLGAGFLFLLSGKLQVPELFPELILSSFFILLGFWVKSILSSKEASRIIPEEHRYKRDAFRYQSWGVKSELKRENGFYFLAFIGISIITFVVKDTNLVYAFTFFLFLVFGICLFFVPILSSFWAHLNLLKDRYYYHLVGFFVREKNRSREACAEEENVLGINY